MATQNNIPNERKMKRDYFFIGVYILVALVVLIQFGVIFLIDILDYFKLI